VTKTILIGFFCFVWTTATLAGSAIAPYPPIYGKLALSLELELLKKNSITTNSISSLVSHTSAAATSRNWILLWKLSG